MTKHYNTIVIGGGAAGMMAAIFSALSDSKTLIIEHNEKLGKKLFITGKGRCNLTNNSSIENHLNNIITNSKFMYSALNSFSPYDVIEFFENSGLKLKTERGGRVFPNSDKSSDVIKALTNRINSLNIDVKLNTAIDKVYKNNLFNIMCADKENYTSDNIIVATGGLSYSGTGATDFGYKVAKSFGHNIVSPKSALCPIVVKDDISILNGLSLKNVSLSIIKDEKILAQEQGEMMFTYTSITGPIALCISSKINKIDLNKTVASIDFKPALTVEQLDAKFLREFKENSKKNFKTYLISILPSKIIDIFMIKAKLSDKKLSEISKQERQQIINTLKRFDLNIKYLDNINVSIVTSGGVDVREISAKTCESKILKGLYFAGEVIDVDALTGGYNLQIAWSTGYLAGTNAKGKL